jgi:hypothetical protein
MKLVNEIFYSFSDAYWYLENKKYFEIKEYAKNIIDKNEEMFYKEWKKISKLENIDVYILLKILFFYTKNPKICKLIDKYKFYVFKNTIYLEIFQALINNR